jgi:hypothetical protein
MQCPEAVFMPQGEKLSDLCTGQKWTKIINSDIKQQQFIRQA